METVKLSAKKRDMSVKAKDYRKQDKITGEYYGKGVTNLSIAMDYQEFKKVYKQAGKSTVLNLEIEGEKPTYALVQEVDYNPVTDDFLHIDFIHVDLDKEVTTKIPYVFVGVSPAVKDLHGTLNLGVDSLEVKCLAKDLVHSIEVDISSLVDFNSVLHVSDVKVPAGLTVVSSPMMVVATVTPVREDKEETASAAATVAAEGAAPAEGAAAEGAAAEGAAAKPGAPAAKAAAPKK